MNSLITTSSHVWTTKNFYLKNFQNMACVVLPSLQYTSDLCHLRSNLTVSLLWLKSSKSTLALPSQCKSQASKTVLLSLPALLIVWLSNHSQLLVFYSTALLCHTSSILWEQCISSCLSNFTQPITQNPIQSLTPDHLFGQNTPVLWCCLGQGNGNPLQYSCLENLMDRGD